MKNWPVPSLIRAASGAVIFASVLLVAQFYTASAVAEQGTCSVTAGTNAGHKYATLKCAKASSPNNFIIRSTAWEREDKKRYRELVPLAGHSFSCTLKRGGQKRRGRKVIISFDISNCR